MARLLGAAKALKSIASGARLAHEATSDAGGGVRLTEACVRRLKEVRQERGKDVYLRVSVEGGGCSGFQYSFSLDHEPQEGDRCAHAANRHRRA